MKPAHMTHGSSSTCSSYLPAQTIVGKYLTSFKLTAAARAGQFLG